MSINRVVISGNVTRKNELRSTAGGMSVLGFGVAVNDRRKNPQSGEYEDYPNFIDCTLFGKRAESINRMIDKGTKVAIEGKLRWSQWENNGEKRSKLEVIVDDIDIMTRQKKEGEPDMHGQFYAPPTVPMATPVVDASVYDEDIPF